jgi:hypothetical protein
MLGAIRSSTYDLSIYAESGKQIHMPFPGIGNGELEESLVWDIVKDLPDNVNMWKLL